MKIFVLRKLILSDKLNYLIQFFYFRLYIIKYLTYVRGFFFFFFFTLGNNLILH